MGSRAEGCWAPWRPKGRAVAGDRCLRGSPDSPGARPPWQELAWGQRSRHRGPLPGQAVLRARVGVCRNGGKGRGVEDAGHREAWTGLGDLVLVGLAGQKGRGHPLCPGPWGRDTAGSLCRGSPTARLAGAPPSRETWEGPWAGSGLQAPPTGWDGERWASLAENMILCLEDPKFLGNSKMKVFKVNKQKWSLSL